MKNYAKAGGNLFLKLLHQGKMSSDEKNDIILETANGNIALDCLTKT